MDQETESRFQRIEVNLEAVTQHERLLAEQQRQAVEDTADFKRLVRGAFTVQSEQIEKLRQSTENLEKQLQAYLRRVPPQ